MNMVAVDAYKHLINTELLDDKVYTYHRFYELLGDVLRIDGIGINTTMTMNELGVVVRYKIHGKRKQKSIAWQDVITRNY